MKTITLFIIWLCVLTNINAQTPKEILSPTKYCCDNFQAEDQYAEDLSSVGDINNNCLDVTITVRNCVDRTRDALICGGIQGSRYCREDSNFNNWYPRYYALYHPIIVSPSSLTFSTQYGGGNPSSQTFSISNGVWQAFQIDNTLNWNASKTQNWLTFSPASGTVSGTTPVSVTASVNVSGLAPGTYTDEITVAASQVSNRQYERIIVTLNITSSFSVSISGPTYLACSQIGTWTASVAGGTSPYYYQWYYYVPCDISLQTSSSDIKPLAPPCGNWFQSGTNSQTFTRGACTDFEVKCVVRDALNNYRTSNIVYVSVGGSAKIADQNTIEKTVSLEKTDSEYSASQNFPKPFNPTTEIRFAIMGSTHVKLIVYDMLGREVSRLADKQMNAGYHSITWNASSVSSGNYIYKLSIGNIIHTKRMILMK